MKLSKFGLKCNKKLTNYVKLEKVKLSLAISCLYILTELSACLTWTLTKERK